MEYRIPNRKIPKPLKKESFQRPKNPIIPLSSITKSRIRRIPRPSFSERRTEGLLERTPGSKADRVGRGGGS